MHEFPNGKKYVGITSMDTSDRWGKNGINYREQKIMYRAIKKYGWDNIKHIVLFTELTKLEAFEKEREFIKSLNTMDKQFGYNVLPGGDSMPIVDRSIPVICLNTLKVYKSAAEASIETGINRRKISSVCCGSINSAGKDMNGIPLKWEHYDKNKIYTKYTQKEIKTIIKKIKSKPVNCKMVICLNNLKIFNSIKEAAHYAGLKSITSIIKVCKGKTRYAGKDPITNESLMWEYYDKTKTYSKQPYEYKNDKYTPIICLNTLKIYNTIAEAGRDLKVDTTEVCRMCKHKHTRTRGIIGKNGYLYIFSYYIPDETYTQLPLKLKNPLIECTTLNKIFSLDVAIKDTKIRRCFILDVCNGVKSGCFSKTYGKVLNFKYVDNE